MIQGKIIKLTGGLYTVVDEMGKRVELRPVGLFRYQKISPKVGDNVMFDEESIKQVLPRRNEMIRPAIANVDFIMVVNSCQQPDFSFLLLDRFLALVAKAEIPVIIVITKTDLLNESELNSIKQKLKYYQKFYPVFFTASPSLLGIDAIKELIYGKIIVLSGQTGAGKSSMLNAIDPKLNIKTNTISKALGRGKHTTRHVELINICGGWIADTPGFSKLDLSGFEAKTFNTFYPDFVRFRDECRFNGCTHTNEPGCRIKALVQTQDILPERYENYLRLYEEIKSQKPNY
ncbi:MAG: ribosome small subunit-dependent GTPase A [Candidatus Izemoplasmatales bacterium]|nr:ribosome small subunit-dependent GTPase A [Candidatus Izemoplasmatales bacterium]MDD3865838.1 ribosome small subunit-dependent GTPase A [Candidatus Izemoplasmatales bacterium]